MAYIYGLTDPRTGEVRYVGKATDVQKRLYMHLFHATTELPRWRDDDHKARWIRQLVNLGLVPGLVILEEVDGNWQEAERRWIGHFEGLTNIALGGQGVDAPRTEIWRRRIGASHKGKVIRPETREKLSAFMLAKRSDTCKAGHPWTPETTITVNKKGHLYRVCRTCKNEKHRQRRVELGLNKGRRRATCRRGHPLSGDNLRLLERRGKVEHICRQCVRDRNRKAKARARARKGV